MPFKTSVALKIDESLGQPASQSHEGDLAKPVDLAAHAWHRHGVGGHKFAKITSILLPTICPEIASEIAAND